MKSAQCHLTRVYFLWGEHVRKFKKTNLEKVVYRNEPGFSLRDKLSQHLDLNDISSILSRLLYFLAVDS